MFEVVTAYYRKVCDYMAFRDQGIIEGRGCGTVSMTKRSRYMKDAYELGRGLICGAGSINIQAQEL